MNELNKILELLHKAEKLKIELRHSWTSNNKQESVADHSWRLSLMVIIFEKYLDKKINLEKALKMAIIHDLPESLTGDIPFFEIKKKSNLALQKYSFEKKAMLSISNLLDKHTGSNLYELWNDFEKANSYEAKFVKALDKIEAQIQQNEAPISSWLEKEAIACLNYLDEFCDFDSFLKKIKEIVRNESINILKKTTKFNFTEIKLQALIKGNIYG